MYPQNMHECNLHDYHWVIWWRVNAPPPSFLTIFGDTPCFLWEWSPFFSFMQLLQDLLTWQPVLGLDPLSLQLMQVTFIVHKSPCIIQSDVVSWSCRFITTSWPVSMQCLILMQQIVCIHLVSVTLLTLPLFFPKSTSILPTHRFSSCPNIDSARKTSLSSSGTSALNDGKLKLFLMGQQHSTCNYSLSGVMPWGGVW